MKIIISPTKKMNIDTDSLPYENLPQFINEAEILMKCLQVMDYDELKELWRCNDSIAKLNYQRLQGMDVRHNLTPAGLSFQGILSQYMAPLCLKTGIMNIYRSTYAFFRGFMVCCDLLMV